MLKDIVHPGRIRFTLAEVEEAASYGLDLKRVRSRQDLVDVEIELIKRVGERKPEIVEALVREVAKSNPKYKLPPKPSAVRHCPRT